MREPTVSISMILSTLSHTLFAAAAAAGQPLATAETAGGGRWRGEVRSYGRDPWEILSGEDREEDTFQSQERGFLLH